MPAITHIDKDRFGPWAIVTGASSGIGKEFARQLAASGLNLILVARRLPLLEALEQQLTKEFKVQYRAIGVDLSEENFIEALNANRATHIPGRMFRIMAALTPRSIMTRMNGRMLAKALAAKHAL